MINLNLLKLILLVAMIAATLIAGLLPMKVLKVLRHSAAVATTSQQHKHVSLVLCLLTCFSGGVFLATCFLHLFPELVENIEKMDRVYKVHVDYPLAELLSCLGFFLLFFLEELIILMIPSMAHGHSHEGHGHAHGHSQEHTPLTTEPKDSGCCMTGVSPAVGNSVTRETIYHHEEQSVPLSVPDVEADEEVAGHCQKHCPLTVHTRRTGSGRNSPECAAPVGTEFKTLTFAEPERCERDCEKFEEDPPILMKSSPHAHSHGVRSTTLVLALSIHSVIEGIALGVGNTNSETTALFLSLMVHKLIVAFSVGLQLARTHAHQYKWVVASIVTLSIMTPFGTLIGMAVKSVGDDSLPKEVALTVLQGLAVGTFLYVTFFEVLLHERDNEHPNLLKLLVIMLGFGLIALLRLADDHDHGHSHGAAGNNTFTEFFGNLTNVTNIGGGSAVTTVDVHAGHSHN